MKDPKKLVCNVELAKQLDELDIKIDSYFMWVKYEMWKEPKVWISDMASDVKTTCLSGKREYCYSAPTVGELGEVLPFHIEVSMEGWELYVEKIRTHWSIKYQNEFNVELNTIVDNEVDTRTKMIIYLKINKLI